MDSSFKRVKFTIRHVTIKTKRNQNDKHFVVVCIRIVNSFTLSSPSHRVGQFETKFDIETTRWNDWRFCRDWMAENKSLARTRKQTRRKERSDCGDIQTEIKYDVSILFWRHSANRFRRESKREKNRIFEPNKKKKKIKKKKTSTRREQIFRIRFVRSYRHRSMRTATFSPNE